MKVPIGPIIKTIMPYIKEHAPEIAAVVIGIVKKKLEQSGKVKELSQEIISQTEKNQTYEKYIKSLQEQNDYLQTEKKNANKNMKWLIGSNLVLLILVFGFIVMKFYQAK